MSAWATSKTVRVSHTNFIENSLAVETQTAKPNLHVFALAIIYVTTTSESSDLAASTIQAGTSSLASSPTAASASEESSSESGLSTGASAGIGVAAAVGVALLAVVAWWVYRRRRSQRQAPELVADQPRYTPEMAGQMAPSDGCRNAKNASPTRSELPDAPAPQELPAYR
ncbi:hypothetical protein Daus18300_011032 [Diaporthe australafricana]|uniref:Mid2 domain-containing protein n=1 Tax=Diaporthe australafricana TaxID=127596 RepID=A0ABR3W827_9PEZI